MKLAVFDFDSTLMDGETIDFLAAELGIEKQVATITERAMAGELDFHASLVERVALLKGLEKKRVEAICRALPLMPGAQETVAQLKEHNCKVVCFSGGFRCATRPAALVLGLDGEFSNKLFERNGILTGQIGGEMMYGEAKGEMLERLQRLLGITRADTMVVGDGANDLSMFAHADTRVAFRAKPVLVEQATHVVTDKDLRRVLEMVR